MKDGCLRVILPSNHEILPPPDTERLFILSFGLLHTINEAFARHEVKSARGVHRRSLCAGFRRCWVDESKVRLHLHCTALVPVVTCLRAAHYSRGGVLAWQPFLALTAELGCIPGC